MQSRIKRVAADTRMLISSASSSILSPLFIMQKNSDSFEPYYKVVMSVQRVKISERQIGQLLYFAYQRAIHWLQKAWRQGNIMSLMLSRHIAHSSIGVELLIYLSTSSLLITWTSISFFSSSSSWGPPVTVVRLLTNFIKFDCLGVGVGLNSPLGVIS